MWILSVSSVNYPEKQRMPLKSKTSQDYLRHNKVKLITGGNEYFSLLEEMIDSAKETIHFQTYIWDEDETGTAVANAMIRAAKRNVKIYVLLDAYGSQSLSGDFIEKLTDAGIFFRKFKPLFKTKRFYLGRRLHHKIVVVDSYRSTVAGLNISNRYNDMPGEPAWMDWALYAEGEVSLRLEEICFTRLKMKGHRVTKAQQPPQPTEVCLVGVRVNDWVTRKRQIYHTYLEMFQHASDHLIILSAYFLPGRPFRRRLADAARRGVKIKVILTGVADVPMIKYAERYMYHWLFKNNIEVYEYQKSVLHGKMATCDGKFVTVGSFNVNNLSAYGSIEVNLDVKDQDFAKCTEARLEKIIDEDCLHVTEADFKKLINLFERAGHKMAYEIVRFFFFLGTRQRG